MGFFSDAQGQLTPLLRYCHFGVSPVNYSDSDSVCGPIQPNFELIQSLIYVIVTCKYEKDPIKNSRENAMAPFSPS